MLRNPILTTKLDHALKNEEKALPFHKSAPQINPETCAGKQNSSTPEL
jgi:hypothetical protein